MKLKEPKNPSLEYFHAGNIRFKIELFFFCLRIITQKDTITKAQKLRTLSTNEILKLLNDANKDFDLIMNQALNNYLPKIFLSCPFTDEICIKKQCIGCDSYDLKKNVTKGRYPL